MYECTCQNFGQAEMKRDQAKQSNKELSWKVFVIIHRLTRKFKNFTGATPFVFSMLRFAFWQDKHKGHV